MPTLRGMPQPDAEALLRDLDPEQLEAVRLVDGPVAILAGAGTGKTRVISRRAAHAIATNAVPADKVLLVTFTDKAADGDGRADAGARPARGHGADVPRPRAEPATTLLAQPPRRRAAARDPRLQAPLIIAGSPGSCPATTASRPPRTSPTRSSGPRPAASGPGATRPRPRRPAASRRSRPTCSRASTPTTSAPRSATSRIDFDDMLSLTVEPARDRPGRRRDRPGPEDLDQRRRVPGHEPAPGAPAGAVARRVARPLRRRRCRPDDLHLHRRHARLPDRLRGTPSRRPRDHALAQLPELAADPRAREPAARRRGPPEAARGHDARRAEALDRSLRRRRCGARAPGRDDRTPRGGGDRGVGDRDPRSHQRPDPTRSRPR